jgi:hypothetical protein
MKARVTIVIAVFVAAVFELTIPVTTIQGAEHSKKVTVKDLLGTWETHFHNNVVRDKASIEKAWGHFATSKLSITNQFGQTATGYLVGGRIKVTDGWPDTTPKHPLYGELTWTQDEKLKIEWGELLEGHGTGGFWVKQ